MKILIVDDVPTNSATLALLMEPFGSCAIKDNGKEAVTAFEEALTAGAPYLLVFLDILMPGGMDGHEALVAMRQAEAAADPASKAFIIMVTGVDDRTEVLKAFVDGSCNDYITKPITPDNLFPRLAELGLINEDGTPLDRT